MRLGFIGSGKMAEAMISGLLEGTLVVPENITASGPREERGEKLLQHFPGITVTTDNLQVVKTDIIVLSVKPQTLPVVLRELHGQMNKEALVISIVAGMTIERIAEGLGHDCIVRSMPNTPGQINQGITVWTKSECVSSQQEAHARTILGALGKEIQVKEEKYIDMATALSGSGPAYVFLFMEALIFAGVRIGLPREIAYELVMETLQGAGEYAYRSGRDLELLRNEVTSPAGTTAAALYELESAGFRVGIADAVKAAFLRSFELGKSNGNSNKGS